MGPYICTDNLRGLELGLGCAVTVLCDIKVTSNITSMPGFSVPYPSRLSSAKEVPHLNRIVVIHPVQLAL